MSGSVGTVVSGSRNFDLQGEGLDKLGDPEQEDDGEELHRGDMALVQLESREIAQIPAEYLQAREPESEVSEGNASVEEAPERQGEAAPASSQ